MTSDICVRAATAPLQKLGRLNYRAEEFKKRWPWPCLYPPAFIFVSFFLLRKQLCSCNRSKWKARGLGRLRKQPVFKIISCKFLPFLGRFAGLDKANLKKKGIGEFFVVSWKTWELDHNTGKEAANFYSWRLIEGLHVVSINPRISIMPKYHIWWNFLTEKYQIVHK